MKPALSVLDPSPLFEGRSAKHALSESLALAEAVDGMGLRAYWVQEHHNAASFAGTAPEVLIAALGQRTKKLKIGSGGVMLPNYSPLKVAEQFCALEALTPGRVELGIGRATGADPRASAALLGPGPNEFSSMMRLLMDWLLDTSGEAPLPEGHPANGIRVGPRGARPDLWMLSSSVQSAAFAGAMGVKLAFADFLSPGVAGAAIRAYKTAFEPSPFAAQPYAAVGLVALAADSEDEAIRLGQSGAAWNLARATGQFRPFQSADVAGERLARASEQEIMSVRARAIVGDAENVTARLVALAQNYEADELLILTIADTVDARARSYELIQQGLMKA